MSTQTSALPDGTTLTKPASGERVSLSVINTNTDNIANNIIGLNGKITPIAISDCNAATETGRYLTSVSTQNQPSASHWIIDVIKYNANEISQVARGIYANNIFSRSYVNGTWNAWEQLALNSKVTTFNIMTGWATTSTPLAITITKRAGIILFRVPSTSTAATISIGFFVRQNNYPNFAWLGATPSKISVSTSENTITVSTTAANGVECNTLEFVNMS